MTGYRLQRRYPAVLTDDLLKAAACRGKADSNTVFFKDDNRHGSFIAGRQLCAQCPLTGLRGPCAQDAINHGDTGLRGGTTEHDRADALSAGLVLRQAVCGHCGTYYQVTSPMGVHCSEACAKETKRLKRVASDRRIHQIEMAS